MAAKKRVQHTRALARRPTVQVPLARLPEARGDESRLALGRTRDGAVILPAPPRVVDLPSSYAEALTELKQRIQQTRLATILTANTAMVRLYWRVGSVILAKQDRAGWGAKVIDRLSHDLRSAFPDMAGLSSRNLKYMRSFAAAWSEREIAQAPLAQLTWYHHLALLEKLDDKRQRLWYASQTVEHGWSRNILAFQIQGQLRARLGRAPNNFKRTLPPADSDFAANRWGTPVNSWSCSSNVHQTRRRHRDRATATVVAQLADVDRRRVVGVEHDELLVEEPRARRARHRDAGPVGRHAGAGDRGGTDPGREHVRPGARQLGDEHDPTSRSSRAGRVISSAR